MATGNSSTPSPNNFLLLVIEYKGLVQEIFLTEKSYFIGRGKKCDIVVGADEKTLSQLSRIGRDNRERIIIGSGSETISRIHATLLRVPREPEEYCISDGEPYGKKSSNGILYKGTKIPSRYLKHGDVIEFGEARLTYLENKDPSENQDTVT